MTICAYPFTVPRTFGEGQAAVVYMKAQPTKGSYDMTIRCIALRARTTTKVYALKPMSTTAFETTLRVMMTHTSFGNGPFVSFEVEAIMCIMGKPENKTTKDTNAACRTVFAPQRRNALGKTVTCIVPLNRPIRLRMIPISEGGRPRPPEEIGTEIHIFPSQ